VKSLMLFLQFVLQDMEDMCRTSTIRDRKTITERVEHEGFSFLTITLANFGSDLQKGLDQGFVDHDLFVGFKRRGGLPRFLGGFLDRVFDRKTGRLLNDPSVDHIIALRQICLMWSKILLDCAPHRREAAFRRYVECEKEVRNIETAKSDYYRDFDRVSVLLWGYLLSSVDLRVYEDGVTPGHGPGVTADSISGNRKWSQQTWTNRLDKEFPVGDYLIPSARYYQDLETVNFLEPGQELPVKVVAVPKTLKTPRIIAIEPTCMQYVQQGLLRVITEAVEASDSARRLIGWQSSTPNQELACRASRDGSLATLDLKDASDRVSNQHVRRLLRNHGTLRRAVDACRSRKADVPGHGVIRLAKFASMGSALTFPFEAMVFLTIVFIAVQKELNRPLTKGDIQSLIGQVRVFGDDIIVPVDYAIPVARELEAFGLRVNAHKSYWTGKFRESCGGEYYDGHDVSIVKVRRVFPLNRRCAREIVSTVELRNHLYLRGYWQSAAYLDALLLRHIPMPRVLSTSPGLGRISFLGYSTDRMDPEMHRPLVRAAVFRGVIPPSRLDGASALLKCLVESGKMPIPDSKHLERSGRPRSVSIKTRWVTPF